MKNCKYLLGLLLLCAMADLTGRTINPYYTDPQEILRNLSDEDRAKLDEAIRKSVEDAVREDMKRYTANWGGGVKVQQ